MAMKKCKECGEEISSSAKTCPKCGKRLKPTGLRIFLGIILIIIGLGMMFGSDNTTTNNTTTNTNGDVAIEQKTETSKVTKENYNKIKNGMTEKEVEKILGQPASTSENEIEGLGKTVLKHYQEGFSLKGIDVYFHNGKVNMKNWTEL